MLTPPTSHEYMVITVIRSYCHGPFSPRHFFIEYGYSHFRRSMSTMASNANYSVFFSGSLINLPKLSFGDVCSIVQRECVTKGSKLDRGYISSSTSSSYSVMKVIIKCQLLISFRNVALASKQAQIAISRSLLQL